MRFHPLICTLFLASGTAFGQGQDREVSMCKATTITLKAVSTGALRYEWYHNNEIVVGSGGSELVVGEEGTYKAFGVNQNGCLSAESIRIIVRHHKPSAVDDIATGKINTDLLLDVLKNDQSVCTDFDVSTLTVVQQPTNGTVARLEGNLIFSPAHDFTGQVTFTYSVSDENGQESNVASVKLQIVTDPLPVTLTYFEVRKTESVARIDWGTSHESNSDHFDIERSTDLNIWTLITRAKAAFESSNSRNYSEVDSFPETGLNYYRLKMVDADNTFAFSKIKSVHFPEFSWAEVYPNPVDNLLYIVVRNKKISNVRMISHAGIIHFSRLVTAPSFIISMKDYPLGLHYIHFEQDDGAVKIYKVMHN